VENLVIRNSTEQQMVHQTMRLAVSIVSQVDIVLQNRWLHRLDKYLVKNARLVVGVQILALIKKVNVYFVLLENTITFVLLRMVKRACVAWQVRY
jgi:hypothetical protein